MPQRGTRPLAPKNIFRELLFKTLETIAYAERHCQESKKQAIRIANIEIYEKDIMAIGRLKNKSASYRTAELDRAASLTAAATASRTRGSKAAGRI